MINQEGHSMRHHPQIPRSVPTAETVEPIPPESPQEGTIVKTVILWSNGMVTVFDEHGEQMPSYQGRRSEALEKLRALDLSQTEFYIGSWGKGTPPSTLPCTKEQFFCESWK